MSRSNRIDNFHQCAFNLGTNIVCKLLTLSDSYMVDEMLLRWKRFIPVQINDELELPTVYFGSNSNYPMFSVLHHW